jgi:hypothetical protein
MTHDEIKQTVLTYISKNDCVSYAELERIFEKIGFDYSGNLEICSNVNDMVVFWGGWNEEAIALINELKRDNLVHQDVAQPLVYLIDGKGMSYPLVKSNRPYKTPRWLPLVFRPGVAK